MRIVHVGASDCNGGAARAAYRLHDGLRRLGEDSTMFVATRVSHDPTVVQFSPSSRWGDRILRTARRARIALAAGHDHSVSRVTYSMFSDDRSAFSKEPWTQCPSTDLIHLHWIAGFVDFAALIHRLPDVTPIVWTLHDMNPFTGGCHYDMGCDRFTACCGMCPQLGSKEQRDLSRQIWQRKRKAFLLLQPDQLHIVTPSKWLGEQLGRSSLLCNFPRAVIPYGLNTEIFRPRDPVVMREALGIPIHAKVVLFVADGLNDPRKGFEFLLRALEGAESQSETVLLSLGAGKPPVFRKFPHVHVQSIQDDRLLSFVYSTADVFVAPSIQDNLPNTVLESMACGTPVVGFRAGGIPEAVQHGQCGLVVPPGSVQELREAVLHLVECQPTRLEMSKNCRRIAVGEYQLEVQASRYLNLYRERVDAIGFRRGKKTGRGRNSESCGPAAELSRANQ